MTGPAVYDQWDRRNKRLHAQAGSWRQFAELAVQALTGVYQDFQRPAYPDIDCTHLLESMADWPLWPDVTTTAITKIDHPLGLLTNIVDRLLSPTAVVRLGVFDPTLALTSQQLQTYKPELAFYQRAIQKIDPFTHVASSARDVRGALEAKLTCIRIARPGHVVDPAGPSPTLTINDVAAVATTIDDLHSSSAARATRL